MPGQAPTTSLRLIMNLTASNSVMHTYGGDTGSLPSLSAWRGVVMQDNECLLCSWEDLKGCFYLISMDGWEKYFVFNLPLAGPDLAEVERTLLMCTSVLPGIMDKIASARTSGHRLWLSARVIPMGWVNAVGIVQCLHRELLLAADCERNQAAPTQASHAPVTRGNMLARQELRRDRFVPPLSQIKEWQQMWQVYIDDFDLAELFHTSRMPLVGTVSAAQLQVRAAYRAWSAPTSEHKAGTRALEATRLGMSINGATGRLGVPGRKLSRLLLFTRYCINRKGMSLQAWQVLMGHWVHALMARRETMSIFVEVWQRMRRWGMRCLPMGVKCEREMLTALCHLPLLHVSLRWPVSAVVTASDASETGGGLTFASELTSAGKQEVEALEATPIAWGRDRLMLITLNDEVGTVRMAFHKLGLEVTLMACYVKRPAVTHLLRQSLGDVACVQSLRELRDWLSAECHAHPRIEFVLVCGLERESHDVELLDQIACLVNSVHETWNVHRVRFLRQVSSGDQSVWSAIASWRRDLITASVSDLQDVRAVSETDHSKDLRRSAVEDMEETLGLHRHATGGLLPGHLQRQLHRDWLCARVMLLREALPVQALLPVLEEWTMHIGVCSPLAAPAYSHLQSHQVLLRHLLRRVTSRGSDVRMSTGLLLDPRCWPRASVDPRWWDWHVALSYPLDGEHINALEMRAVVMMHRWRLRHGHAIGLRYVHLVDSGVCLSVMTKGRSSSKQLNFVLRKLNSRVLASCSLPSYCYVRTFYNPADAPSRWQEV
eukprot:6492539-Amphidinium_carterae.1